MGIVKSPSVPFREHLTEGDLWILQKESNAM